MRAGSCRRPVPFPRPLPQFLGRRTHQSSGGAVADRANQSPDGKSDVLAVMGGSGAAGGVSRQVTVAGNATSVTLDNAVGFVASDLFLVSQNGTADCLLEEVASVATPTLTLGGTLLLHGRHDHHHLDAIHQRCDLRHSAGQRPVNNLQFELIGVGTNNRSTATTCCKTRTARPGNRGRHGAGHRRRRVSNKCPLRRRVPTAPGVLDHWAGPGDAGYDIITVMTTPATMRTDHRRARRTGAARRILRQEPSVAGEPRPSSMDIRTARRYRGSAVEPGAERPNRQHYRYRVFEFTVPLRNMILLAGGPWSIAVTLLRAHANAAWS